MKNKLVNGQLQQIWRPLMRMRTMLFLILLVALYGFVGLQISRLASADPDASAIADKAPATPTPHIDKEVVKKIKQLQDSNVNVQALFDQARQNPFRE